MVENTPLHGENVTQDAFLGELLTINQPRKGYRAGIDPVFLAACVSAKKGERVLEVGGGVGVASLCLARRIEDIEVTALEMQEPLAALAKENTQINHLEDRVTILCGDLLAPPLDLKEQIFDHVMANPPYYDPGKAQVSPITAKARSHMTGDAGLAQWLDFCVRRLKPKGTLTLIHRPESLSEILSALDGRVGGISLFPLWPGNGRPAKRLIISGIKGSAAQPVLKAGLVLHEEGKRYSEAAECVLRKGKACPIDAQ